MKKFLLTLICTSTLSFNLMAQKSSVLIPVGGGANNAAVTKKILSSTEAKSPLVLIIANASSDKEISNTIQKSKNYLTKFGLTNLKGLDVNNVEESKSLIATADIIWMPGGKQGKLAKDLKANQLDKEILKRYKSGNIVITGTSAGASIMSDVMIQGSEKDASSGTITPKLSTGFKLWPTVIIDQHFSERNRLGRLKSAVTKNEKLLGIGIDEGTAVVYENDSKIGVVGKGTVSFVKKEKGTDSLKVTVLRSGETYTVN